MEIEIKNQEVGWKVILMVYEIHKEMSERFSLFYLYIYDNLKFKIKGIFIH